MLSRINEMSDGGPGMDDEEHWTMGQWVTNQQSNQYQNSYFELAV